MICNIYSEINNIALFYGKIIINVNSYDELKNTLNTEMA